MVAGFTRRQARYGALDEERARRILLASMFGHDPQPVRIGRYEVGRLLGSGAAGVVHRAYDPELGRDVALKLVSGQAPTWNERLIEEARALARIDHPNVVKVFDVGRFDVQGVERGEAISGGVYVAMEYIDGVDLRRWFQTCEDPWQRVEAMSMAGRGLQAAHRARIVHRDFKPSNVMRGDDGRVVVLDFGLAMDWAETPETRDTGGGTPTRVLIRGGTPGYMAPEQRHGADVDARADQYSFCVSLFEAWFGRLPFEGQDSGDGGTAISWPLRPRMPLPLRRLLERGLSPDPSGRFVSFFVLLKRLESVLSARRRRTLLRGSAVSILTVGIASWGVSSPAAEQSSTCVAAVSELEASWSEPTTRAMAKAFASSERPYAGEAWAVLDERMSRFVERWTSVRSRVCAASSASPEQARARALALRCLDRARGKFDATVQFLHESSSAPVERAVGVAEGLLDPSSCLEGARSGAAVGEAFSLAEAVLQSRLDAGLLLHDAGQPAGANILLESVLLEARALDLPRLQAEAALASSHALDALGRTESGRATLEEGTWLALQYSWPELALEGVARIMEHAVWDGRLQDVAPWEERAQALNCSWCSGAARLALSSSFWALARQEPDAALEHALQAVEGTANRPELRPRALHGVSRAARTLGDFELALQHAREALALVERRYGVGHPITFDYLIEVGDVLERSSQWEQAERVYARAQDVCRDSFEPEHFCRPVAAHRLAEIRLGLGRYELARRDSTRALEAATQILGASHPMTAVIDTVLTRAHLALGDLVAAERSAAQARSTFETVLGPTHANTWIARLDWAEVQARSGRWDAVRDGLSGPSEPEDPARKRWRRVLIALAERHASGGARADACEFSASDFDEFDAEGGGRIAIGCADLLMSTADVQAAMVIVSRALRHPGRMMAATERDLNEVRRELEREASARPRR